MEKLFLLIVVISTCLAEPKDLSGKVLVFTKETNSDFVKLQTTKTLFSSATVCLRFLTDLKRTYSLFSLSTSDHLNDFLFYKPSEDVLRIHARDEATDFLSLSLPANTWHSICATWRSDNGLAQLWVDGLPTIKRYIISGKPISGAPSTILGQEQDTYGGGFEASQSFIGMISKLHMWDYVLSDIEIKRYMNDKYFTPGNVFNWGSLEYEITGLILVEDDPENM
ncbi:female protein [Scophthalmus maximus]|uniref:Pentraxin family member n=1 Tax=Scophthalmus maximus TaxID=52904 RepID=A0A8D3E2X0_SCOMX|nr:female protein [Scophthalmus maximus]XP_035485830.1 female protein [Scophthalmus maximus]XP_035485831.1 female protein [Scophthalmus maximus]